MISLGTYGIEKFDKVLDEETGIHSHNDHKWLCWGLMMLAQFITFIVMAQLLIAIINQTFDKVEGMKEPYMFMQRASIIAQT